MCRGLQSATPEPIPMGIIQEYQWLHGDFFENIYGSVTTTIAGYSSCRQTHRRCDTQAEALGAKDGYIYVEDIP